MTWQAKYETSNLRELVVAGTAWGMNLAARRREHFLAWLESGELNAKQVAEKAGVPYTTLHSYVKKAEGATLSLKGDTEARIAAAYDLPVEAIFGSGDLEEEQNFAGAWRRDRGVELDVMARRLGVAVQTLEDLEAGRLSFSPRWRRRVAEALDLNEGYLLLNPENVPAEVMDLFSPSTPPARRERALQMLRLLTGTDG